MIERSRGPRHLVVEITPLIDVVFLLIIFFMVTARFARDTRADIDLPQERGEQRETAEEAGIVVNILADGTIVLLQEEVSLDDLVARVRDEIARRHGGDATQVKLLVRADRTGDTEHLNAVVAQLQKLGIGAAKLATEVP
jgi:biopolymer transport protein ExbD